MKHPKLAIILCLALLPAVSRAADDGYGYPIHDSYEATIRGTPDSLKPDLPVKLPVRHLVVDIIPDLKKPDIFIDDEGLCYTLTYQDIKAPLVFLIPGIGASNQASSLSAMMKRFYKAGCHVITLPSPARPNFIISASQSHVPGDLTEDAADLYKVMETVWNKVKGDIEVSDFSLGGYSLGGAQGTFVAKLDEKRKTLNFRKVLMVNPAVSLYNSVTSIEELLARIPGGPRKIGVFFNRILARFTEFYHKGDFIGINDEFLYAVYTSKLFSRDGGGGLIGLVFRINLAGMVFASDVMTNGGYVVPKNRVLTTADPLEYVESGYVIMAGISTMEAIDMRHREKFRYYESGYPSNTIWPASYTTRTASYCL